MEDIKFEAPELTIAFTRFVTSVMMNVALTQEIKMGMAKMKFALNHQYKFRRWRYAYLTGLF